MPANKSNDSATAVSKTRPSGVAGTGCAVLFFSAFVLMGSGFLYIVFLLPVYNVVRAASWVETSCTIESSRVDESDSEDGATYAVDIEFSYTFAGQSYTSGRYDFTYDDFHSSGRKGKQRIVDRYPPGKQTVCYVNPSDPSFAVLYRGMPASAWWGLLPAVFVFIGGGGLLAMTGVFGPLSNEARRSRWTPKSMRPATARFGPTPADGGDEFSLPARTGPITLRPDASPLAKALGVLAVTLFWNGIVSIFLVGVVGSHLDGKPQWMFTVFLIPFVLVGLLLIFATIHTSLAVFNPRPTLTISDSVIALGERVELAWRFTGNTTSLQRLRIFLEGQEKAQYRRGTTTYTDKNTFLQIDVIDTSNFIEISSGRREFDIPADSMHSFKSNHNEIVWTLRVTCEVAWWPDVNDTYPLVILPHEA